jgi:hypothetical protein
LSVSVERIAVLATPLYKQFNLGVEEPGPFIFMLFTGVYSASNRNEYQKQKKLFLRSKARPARKADNLTAICEPIV